MRFCWPRCSRVEAAWGLSWKLGGAALRAPGVLLEGVVGGRLAPCRSVFHSPRGYHRFPVAIGSRHGSARLTRRRSRRQPVARRENSSPPRAVHARGGKRPSVRLSDFVETRYPTRGPPRGALRESFDFASVHTEKTRGAGTGAPCHKSGGCSGKVLPISSLEQLRDVVVGRQCWCQRTQHRKQQLVNARTRVGPGFSCSGAAIDTAVEACRQQGP